jgi:hypothetical protein
MEDTNRTLLFALLFGEEKEKTKQEINKEVNQRILFDLFLKEQYKKQLNFNETKRIAINRFGSYFTDLKEFIIIKSLENGNKFPLEDLAFNIDMKVCFEKTDRYGYGSVSRNYAKEFFEWAKEKAKEMGMPKNTFKTIHDTKIVARNMFRDWYRQFETSEEMLNWLEGENDIMLK